MVIDLEGQNVCLFRGYIKSPKVSVVGQYNSKLYKATLAVPVSNSYQYIKISSFSCADALSEVREGAFVSVETHFEESSFMGKCRNCGASNKVYWAEFVVDNFKVLD